MPLESANTISELDSRWPLGTDSAVFGDDHIRLIKNVLKKQFPGESGQGFDKPLTVSADYLNDIPGNLFPVGSVVLRMDDVNPATIYGGTWQLIDGDAYLTFGNGSILTGDVVGSNERSVDVPLPLHDHEATFTGDKLPDHEHSMPTEPDGSGGNGSISTGPHQPISNKFKTNATSAGTPSGTVTVQNAGVSDAKINFNVKPASIHINVWERTA
ncbi:tail fiber protein [Vibrio phage vB_ValP_VA-RY-3]|nr:tail fiber protein [Vibrio phage vB_ValP_VA-RY-3]